jgi:hypothetical protein
MTVQYTVQALVVDLNHDEPKTGDMFLVDTNAWYWTHYAHASDNAQRYQIASYPMYLRKAIRARAQLYRCALSFAELAHIIPTSEQTSSQKLKVLGRKLPGCRSRWM